MDEGKELTPSETKRDIASENKETLVPMGPVLYFDRRIWNYPDKKLDGTQKTTIDLIKDLTGRTDLKDSDVKVIDPEVHENIEDVLNRMRPLVGMTLPTIVIPQRTKAYNEMSGNTVWLDVDPEPFKKVGEKYNVSVFQLGKGRLWPQIEGQENSIVPSQEIKIENTGIRRKLLSLIGK